RRADVASPIEACRGDSFFSLSLGLVCVSPPFSYKKALGGREGSEGSIPPPGFAPFRPASRPPSQSGKMSLIALCPPSPYFGVRPGHPRCLDRQVDARGIFFMVPMSYTGGNGKRCDRSSFGAAAEPLPQA